MSYGDLAALARRIRTVERARIGSTLQFGAFQRAGLSDDILALTPQYIEELTKVESALKRQLPKAARAGEPESWLENLVDWIAETVGVGPTVIYVAGLIPPLAAFANPAKLWKYLGLHVEDGKSVRVKRGELAGFSLELRAYALQRIADPIIKQGGEYRDLYDSRKAHTLDTHPPMNGMCPSCELAMRKTKEHRDGKHYTRERKAPSQDCANVGGIHWTDGHRHRDAMRIVAKAVWRDAWKAAHGKLAVMA